MIANDVREIERKMAYGLICTVIAVQDHKKAGLNLQEGAKGTVTTAVVGEQTGLYRVEVEWRPDRIGEYFGKIGGEISEIDVKEYHLPEQKDPNQPDLFIS